MMPPHPSTDVEFWLEYLAALGHSPHTIRAYRRALDTWTDYLARRRIPLRWASFDEATGWIAENGGYASRTVRVRLSALRGFHQWLHATKRSTEQPFEAVKKPRTSDSERPRTLTVREISAMNAHAQSNLLDTAIMALLYGCALRIHEAASLKLVDLDLDTWQLTVTVKHGKRHSIIVPRLSREPIAQWITNGRERRTSNYVFPTAMTGSKTPHLHPNTIGRHVEQLGAAAHVPFKVTAHMLRHARAEHLRARGVDPVTVQKLLGHASLNMTAHYMNPPPTDIDERRTSHVSDRAQPNRRRGDAGATPSD